MKDLKQWFEEVCNETNDILSEAPKFDEPINYGELRCCNVEQVIDMHDEYTRVIIDEAAPDNCMKLCNYVSKELLKRGYSVDEVVTEW